MLLATNARAPVDWGYGTQEFEGALAGSARGANENEGSVASAAYNYDNEDMLGDEEVDDGEDLPDVNELADTPTTKKPSQRSEVLETTATRPVPSTRATRSSNRAEKHVISEDDSSEGQLDDSDYEEPVKPCKHPRLPRAQ